MHTKEIIAGAMHDLMEDTTYVKIATATSFIHALIFNTTIVYYVFTYSNVFAESTPLGGLIHSYMKLVHIDSSMLWRWLLVGLILLIWYELIPPIGEGAMIFYLDDPVEKRDGYRSLAKGLYKFFPMLEFGASTSLFKISFILAFILRLVLYDLRDNTLIMILMSLWITVSFFVTLLLQYTKMLICLEGHNFFDAMKESVSLSIQNLSVTMKFVLINFILSIRFIVNMAIIIGVPIWLISLWAQFGLQNIWRLNTLFLIILIWLVMIAAYIEWIIEWFFTAAWMRIYKWIKAAGQE